MFVFESAALVSEICRRSIESINATSTFHFPSSQDLINVIKKSVTFARIPKNVYFLFFLISSLLLDCQVLITV